jgi:hypothetical protein
MTLESGVQVFAIIHLATMGASHILAHRAWAEFFIALREKGEAGVLVVGFLSLGFGSIVAAFHPVWAGVPLVLTLIGWAQVLKGLIYMSAPGFGLRQLGRVSVERSRMFVVPGVILLGLAGLLLLHLLRPW